MAYSGRIIAIPAGKCPVKLQSTDKEDVLYWAEEVISVGFRDNLNYLPSALIFFAQQFFNIFSEEYRTVYNHLSSSYNTGSTDMLNLIDRISVEKRIADKEKIEKREKEIEKENKKLLKMQKLKEKQAKQKQEEPPVVEQKTQLEKKKIIIRRK